MKEDTIVMFSGGKDSLVLMDQNRDLKAVYIYHELEFDQTLEYVESLQGTYDIEIVKVHKDYFKMCEQLCIPSRRMKWCCKVFKLAPVAAYVKKHKIKRCLTGVRADESSTRSSYEETDDLFFPWIQERPLLNWTEKDIWRYIRNNNLSTNPLYKYLDRVGCWCCPFNSKKDWGVARDFMPEKYAKFKEMIKKVAETDINPEYKRHFLKGGWAGWAYKTDVEIVGNLPAGTDHIEMEKRLNCVGCGACKLLKNVKMGCIARNYNPHRKVMV